MPRSTPSSSAIIPDITTDQVREAETVMSTPSTRATDTDDTSSVMSLPDDESFIDVDEERMEDYDMVDEDEEIETGDEL
jgi:hypothetical protein